MRQDSVLARSRRIEPRANSAALAGRRRRSKRGRPDHFRNPGWLSHKEDRLYESHNGRVRCPCESGSGGPGGPSPTEMVAPRIVTLSQMYKRSRHAMLCATATRRSSTREATPSSQCCSSSIAAATSRRRAPAIARSESQGGHHDIIARLLEIGNRPPFAAEARIDPDFAKSAPAVCRGRSTLHVCACRRAAGLTARGGWSSARARG
jgi:hypothetical protein